MYNLNYTPISLEYEVEEKLHLGVCEKKMLNTAAPDIYL
jgi:hypothetical protein